MKITQKAYIEHLNNNAPPYGDDQWIIGGKLRFYLMASRQYGEALKKHDPIGFRVGFQDYKREKQ